MVFDKKNTILESNPTDCNWDPHSPDGIGMDDQDDVVHSDLHSAVLKVWCTERGVRKRGLGEQKYKYKNVIFASFSSKGQVQISVAT